MRFPLPYVEDKVANDGSAKSACIPASNPCRRSNAMRQLKLVSFRTKLKCLFVEENFMMAAGRL